MSEIEVLQFVAVVCAFLGTAVLSVYAGEWLAEQTRLMWASRKGAVTEYPPPTGEPDTSIPAPYGDWS